MANKGEGTTLQVNDGAASAFAGVADATNITPPGQVLSRINRNRLAATFMERLSGLPDPGQFTYQYELTNSEFGRMEALIGVSKSYKVTYPDSTTLTVTGVMESNKPDQVQAGQVSTATCTVDCRSLVTIS